MSGRLARVALTSTAIGLTAGTLIAVPATAANAVPANAFQAAAVQVGRAVTAPTAAIVPVTPRVAVPAPGAAISAADLRAAKRAQIEALVQSGPSKWRGAPLRHPRRVGFYPEVVRWANLVSSVMAQQGIPQEYLPGILAQIQQESAGDPTAVNRWDSNAKAGTPSMGLLQIIAPTYLAYARKRYRSVQFQAVPYCNIWASLKYARSRYGMSKFAAWAAGANVSY